jgi:hypothetical protein
MAGARRLRRFIIRRFQSVRFTLVIRTLKLPEGRAPGAGADAPVHQCEQFANRDAWE